MSDGVIAENILTHPLSLAINHCLKTLFTMKLKKLTIYCLALFCAFSSIYSKSGKEVQMKRRGNQVFHGWYAEPEGVVL